MFLFEIASAVRLSWEVNKWTQNHYSLDSVTKSPQARCSQTLLMTLSCEHPVSRVLSLLTGRFTFYQKGRHTKKTRACYLVADLTVYGAVSPGVPRHCFVLRSSNFHHVNVCDNPWSSFGGEHNRLCLCWPLETKLEFALGRWNHPKTDYKDKHIHRSTTVWMAIRNKILWAMKVVITVLRTVSMNKLFIEPSVQAFRCSVQMPSSSSDRLCLFTQCFYLEHHFDYQLNYPSQAFVFVLSLSRCYRLFIRPNLRGTDSGWYETIS